MDRYLEGEDIDLEVLIDDLETAVARGSFYPVLAAASPTGLGMAELLEVITQGFPSPLEHALPAGHQPGRRPARHRSTCDPAGPLVAEVVKTTTDPYVGRISPGAGVLRHPAPGHHGARLRAPRRFARHDARPRGPRRRRAVGALSTPAGHDPAHRSSQCIAGDICAVAKLARAETGDTLSDKDDPLLVEPWVMPEPLLPVAIVAATPRPTRTSCPRACGGSSPRTRPCAWSTTPRPTSWCCGRMGEAHVDVLLDRLRTRYGVAGRRRCRCGCRCARPSPARPTGTGRHVKQSGGHGQYAVCDIEVEPLPIRRRLRVRRQGRRRRGAAPVHPQRREGRPRPDGARGAGRLPGGRHPGHAGRRQGALGGLLRHGLPDRRRAGAARRRPRPPTVALLEPVDEVEGASSPTSTSAR